ncbi:MAG TPA: hypothetical protein VLH80_07505 [Nitrospiraceae bacterium]|nr:hypothetical protein [Nitrospiraceae bacterium]
MSSKNAAGHSTTSESPETQAASNDALAKAETIANTPYTPYGGAVVAPESQGQQQATAQASPESALNTQASSLLTQGANDIAGIKQYNSQNLQSYMDPYVQATLTPVLNQENINYATQKSALENSKAGAFGGDRSALEEQSLETSHSQALASDIGNAYSAAYTNAQNAFFNDNKTKIAAGEALAQVGGDVSRLNGEQIQQLMATGGLAQSLNQQQLNFNLNTFLTNQNWSTTQLQPLIQAIAASKGVQTNTSLYGPPSNMGSAALGGAAAGAGLWQQMGGGGGSSSGPDTALANAQSQVAAQDVIDQTQPAPIDFSSGDLGS